MVKAHSQAAAALALRTVPKPMNTSLVGVGIRSTSKQLWFFCLRRKQGTSWTRYLTLLWGGSLLTSKVPSFLELEFFLLKVRRPPPLPYLHPINYFFNILPTFLLEGVRSIFPGFEACQIMRPASELKIWEGFKDKLVSYVKETWIFLVPTKLKACNKLGRKRRKEKKYQEKKKYLP